MIVRCTKITLSCQYIEPLRATPSSSSSLSLGLTSFLIKAILASRVSLVTSTISPSRAGTCSNHSDSSSLCTMRQCFCISTDLKLLLSQSLHFTHPPRCLWCMCVLGLSELGCDVLTPGHITSIDTLAISPFPLQHLIFGYSSLVKSYSGGGSHGNHLGQFALIRTLRTCLPSFWSFKRKTYT